MHDVIDYHLAHQRILETDHGRDARDRVAALTPTAVVSRLLAACHLLGTHLLKLFLAAITSIRFAFGKQFFDDFLVPLETFGLKKRPLVMDEFRPLQTIQDLLNCGIGRALKISVLDAQHERAGVAASIEPTEQGGPETTDVQKPCGTWSESGAYNHRKSGPSRRRVDARAFLAALFFVKLD